MSGEVDAASDTNPGRPTIIDDFHIVPCFGVRQRELQSRVLQGALRLACDRDGAVDQNDRVTVVALEPPTDVPPRSELQVSASYAARSNAV